MSEAMGIIFSNVYDSYMGELTDLRTSAAIPFGGRYRQIDFALSNMTNAQIRHIGIVTKYNYESLMNHIGSCQEWDLELEEKGVVLLPPFATGHTGVYRGKLEALYAALDLLENHSEQKYVILTDTTVLAAVDYAKALLAHEQSGCDITVLAKPGIANGKRCYALAAKTDPAGKPVDLAVDCAVGADYQVSMGMFIISREQIIETIRRMVPHGKYHLERDFILAGFNSGALSVNIFPFEGTALFNESLQEYYQNSMALLRADVRKSLFHSDIPIYTKPRDEVPTFYGKTAEVDRCLVADGCQLNGICKNSVLFREVSVKKNAVVEDSVVMQGCKIGEGAELHCVILDKDVQIRPHAKLMGSKEHPLYINKGATV